MDFTPRASFLNEVGLRRALSDLLGIDVDVVASDTLSGDVGARMLQDAVDL